VWEVDAVTSDHWSEWQDRLAAVHGATDLLVIGRHGKVTDASGKVLAREEVMLRVRRAAPHLPLAALQLRDVQEGAGFSVAPDGRSQGRVAAAQAEQLLRGDPATSMAAPTLAVALRRSFLTRMPPSFSPIYEAVARSVGIYVDD
jgi:hypothetical protein